MIKFELQGSKWRRGDKVAVLVFGRDGFGLKKLGAGVGGDEVKWTDPRDI